MWVKNKPDSTEENKMAIVSKKQQQKKKQKVFDFISHDVPFKKTT